MELKGYVDAFSCDDADMHSLYNTTLKEFYEFKNAVLLTEDAGEDILKSMSQLDKQLAAAKRGLGISNKLTGDAKKKHNRRVMVNLNKIRSQLSKLKKPNIV